MTQAFLIVSRVLVVQPNPTYLVLRRWSAFTKLAANLSALDPSNSLELPVIPPSPLNASTPPRARVQQWLRSLIIALSAPPPSIPEDSRTLANAREEIEGFLLGSGEQTDVEELQDWVEKGEQEEIDAEAKREKWLAAGREGKKLRTTWVMYRNGLIDGGKLKQGSDPSRRADASPPIDEIDKSMATVKRVPLLTQLPGSYRDAETWARIWVAYALQSVAVRSSPVPPAELIFRV